MVYKVITVVPDTYMLNIYYLLLSLLPFYIIILQLYLQSTFFIWKRFNYYSQGCYKDQVYQQGGRESASDTFRDLGFAKGLSISLYDSKSNSNNNSNNDKPSME